MIPVSRHFIAGSIIWLLFYLTGEAFAQQDLTSSIIFNYESKSVFYDTDAAASNKLEIQFGGVVMFSPIWQEPNSPQNYLAHVQIQENVLEKEQISADPFLIKFQDGLPKKFFFLETDSWSSRNLKRGFAISTVTSRLKKLPETDNCIGQDKDEAGKRTLWTNTISCSHLIHLYKSATPLEILNSSIRLEQKVSTDANGELQSSTIVEKRLLGILWSSDKISTVESITTLNRKSSTPNHFIRMQRKELENTLAFFPGFKPDDLGAKNSEFQVAATQQKEPLERTINKLKKHFTLSSGATIKASRALIILQDALAHSNKEEIKEAIRKALQMKKKKQSIINYLLDTIAAVKASEGFSAVEETLNYKKNPDHAELFQRYIIALCLTSQVNEELIQKLLETLHKSAGNQKLEEALSLALGSLGYTLRRKEPLTSQEAILSEIQETITKRLEKCVEPEVAQCQISFLRALGNLASDQSLPIILKYANLGGRAGVTAIRSLRRFDWASISDDLCKLTTQTIWTIYEDPSPIYDSSCKISSAEWVIKRGKAKNLVRLLRGLPGIKNQEVETYILSYLKDAMVDQLGFREALRNSNLGYTELASSGQSVAYSGVLSQKGHMNATYGLAMEVADGTMKTSAFSVGLHTSETDLSVVTFGMYSYGLGSFIGGSEDNSDTSPATAGLELDIFDISIPSLVFFNGMGELMSLAWKTSGDDPVAEMQFNQLLQKHKLFWTISNGVTIETELLSSASIDSAGYVEVSIWNRNSKSLVRNKAAITFEARSTIVAGSVNIPVEFFSRKTLSIQGRMDFQTTVDFSTFEVKLCMQMSHSPIKYRRSSEFKSSLRKNEDRFKSVIPAKSFSFGRKNTRFCAAML